MLTLTLRTDKPEAEIGLFEGVRKVAYEAWQADRQLAESLHQKIHELLKSEKLDMKDLSAIAVFRGPGSFTGLRIGITVANALADSLEIPVVGASGEEWVSRAVSRLRAGEGDRQVVPEYGAPPRITRPKR